MKVRGIKRIMVAAAVAVATAVAGMADQARAFSFGENDLVLAIYGNNTEALYNLGDYNERLADGATFTLDVSAGLSAAQVGTNPVKYTVFGWDVALPDGGVHAATRFSSEQIANSGGILGLTNQFNPLAAWSFNSEFDGNTIAASDPKAFGAQLLADPASMLNGAWPVGMFGELDELLTIMRGDVALNTFTQVGGALLTADGLLTIGNPGPDPIPLPAGVVLFGTGLIGLIGIARRSMKRMVA